MAENEIQTTEQPQSPIMAAAALVQQADGKIDVDKLEALLKVQMQWEANEAKKAYVVAMAAFKDDPPEIVKDRTVSYGQTKYSHASLANVTACINKALSTHGLSAAWGTSQNDGKVRVTCKITHIMGHSEETYLDAPPDDSGKKNVIQQIGSTVTYLQRYTLLALTGLATYDQDNDGNGAGKKPVEVKPPTDEEWGYIDEICKLIPAPDGMRVDRNKVASICYENKQAYPHHENSIAPVVKWLSGEDRPELFMPENRSQAEIALGMPGDEDSRPDTEAEKTAAAKFGEENEQQEAMYRCQKCGLEWSTPKEAAECRC